MTHITFLFLQRQRVRLSPYNIQFAWALDPESPLWRIREVVLPQLYA